MISYRSLLNSTTVLFDMDCIQQHYWYLSRLDYSYHKRKFAIDREKFDEVMK